MPTAQQIITQSLVDLGVYAPGEPVSATESANALSKLNIMLDNWSGARDLVYEIADQVFALTSAQSFPIGPTAASPFTVPRPIKIENAQILITVGGKVLSFDLKILSQAEWQSIDDKGATGTVPERLYYDPTVPNATINLHPIPLAAATTQLDIGTWTVIGQFALLSTNATLPPAYYRAILLGLQLELYPTYDRLINSNVIQARSSQFQEAIGVVRSLNSSVQLEELFSTANPQAAAQGKAPMIQAKA